MLLELRFLLKTCVYKKEEYVKKKKHYYTLVPEITRQYEDLAFSASVG